MLPTDEKAIIHLYLYRLSLRDKPLTTYQMNGNSQISYAQHLYILSDEEIKEGDWRLVNVSIVKDKEEWIVTNKSGFKDIQYKIIATTDTSLWEHDDTVPYPKTRPALPQPSSQFIQKFIEEYNAGRPITKVMVEYENVQIYPQSGRDFQGNEIYEDRLKINLKDNTITIRKVKDTWNREEIISLIKKSKSDFPLHRGIQILDLELDKWIEENL